MIAAYVIKQYERAVVFKRVRPRRSDASARARPAAARLLVPAG
jgi:hypothetical protein